YSGLAPGTSDNAKAGINGWISTGSTTGLTTGRLVFRGTVDRIIIATGEFSANANNMGYNVDYAFDPGRTASITETVRLGYATVVSGTLSVGSIYSVRPSGDGSLPIAGWLVVKSG